MEIKNAQYVKDKDTKKNIGIQATIDGVVWSVSIDESSRYYKEIKKQVDAKTLTIKAAD